MSLREKLIKNSTIDLTASLQDSLVFDKKDSITTKVPMINVALSGTVDGGITPGLTMLAGPSKHFKSGFALLMISAFLEKYSDGVVLFYDSEFGTPKSYFETFNISMNAVIHTPITDIEELKFDIMKQLKELNRDDKVMIVIDSIGNLASKKEVDDALDQKAVADMSRAKQLKSLFRMISPHLTLKNIPLIVVNHVYAEIGLYPKMVVGGGCVVKGTNIITNNGLVSIENLNVGNLVKTLDGLKLITHIWNPETLSDGTPECYEIEFEDGYIVTCSNNHKFIIDNKWITAENLSIGDDVNVC